MIGIKREDLIVTKNSEPLEITKLFFNRLKDNYKNNNPSMSNFVQLLEIATELEFKDIDYYSSWTPGFFSYFLDKQKDYIEGKQINMSSLLEDIEKQFQLSKSEKQLLERKEAEKAVWSIFIMITEPFHKKFNI